MAKVDLLSPKRSTESMTLKEIQDQQKPEASIYTELKENKSGDISISNQRGRKNSLNYMYKNIASPRK
jgi:hypothetical protein